MMAFAITALLGTACEKSGKDVVHPEDLMIRATIESATKAAVTDAGKFTWATGDEMTAYYANSKTIQYTLHSGAGESTGTFAPKYLQEVTGTNPPSGFKYAAYACEVTSENEDGTIKTITLPQTYTHEQSLKLPTPMLAMENTGTVQSIPTVSFRHIAGVVKFTIHVPASNANTTYSDFVIHSKNTDNTVIGAKLNFDPVNMVLKNEYVTSGTRTVKVTDIEYDIVGNGGVATIYVPLPVGNYSSFDLSLESNSSTTQCTCTVTNGGEGFVVEAGTLAIFEELSVGADFKPVS